MSGNTTKLICGQIINGGHCGGVIKEMPRSGGKDPCRCTKCGRKYASYSSLLQGVKADTQGIKIKQFVRKTGTGLFSGSKDVGAVEPLVLETIYEELPTLGIADDLLGLWSDIPDSFGHTRADVQELLSAEAGRLLAENFVLGGIDFNPTHLSQEIALANVRAASINSLTFTGKVSTQAAIDDRRKGIESRDNDERKKVGLVRSERVEACLPYHFASGMMTEAQTKEFLSVDLLSKNLLDSEIPSVDRIHKAVNADKLAKSLASKITNNYDKEVVVAYDAFWKGICSEICNGEFGRCSYWVASPANWFIGEYAAELIKTAFSTGLTVTPMTSLEQLRTVFERGHNYLNDLEFIHSAPRSLRDSLERFSMFNQAYYAIYEGAVAAFKPKPPPPYRFTWRAYTESDLVIITLPSVGLVAGGAAVLSELLAARCISGLATIIVSTRSVAELNDLNAGFIPDFFGKTCSSLITQKDAEHAENASVSNFVYFSIYGDASERGSVVQRKMRRIEKKQ